MSLATPIQSTCRLERILIPSAATGRLVAAPDYLQKADDALTQLLNQKAEEFQQTIAPLQQALVTVQQAEQLQQQANPLNVLPPPGTVNVMPGQSDSGADRDARPQCPRPVGAVSDAGPAWRWRAGWSGCSPRRGKSR